MKAIKRALKQGLAAVGIKRQRNKAAMPALPVEMDEHDRAVVEHVLSQQLTMTSAERLFTTLMAARFVCEAGIAGDFVECGVWRGGNSIVAADVFRRMGPGRKCWMFDTYTGMTEPTEHDVTNRGGGGAMQTWRERERDGHNEWCFASLEDVSANLEQLGLLPQVRLIKGDVLQTLQDEANLPSSIAVLRLDTDWYESTRAELEILYPRLQAGGVLILDDYGHWGGAKKAVDEYFKANGRRPFLQYTDETGRVGVKLGP